MPIKAENKAQYPPNWKEITASIRARAGDKCEICGVKNHAYINRFIDDPEQFVYADDEAGMFWGAENLQDKIIRVVLTVAHLNHDTSDNRPENLKALCQLHHLRHDAQYHAQNAGATRRTKKAAKIEAAGQLRLLE